MVAKNRSFYALLALFTLLAVCQLSAQSYCEIFTKAEADKYYGPVLDSLKMPISDLQELLKKTDEFIMFELKNSSVVILGDGRTVLYPESEKIDSSRVFRVFTKAKTVELLEMDKAEDVFIQQRPSVLTISNGVHVLEISNPCPPFCGPGLKQE